MQSDAKAEEMVTYAFVEFFALLPAANLKLDTAFTFLSL